MDHAGRTLALLCAASGLSLGCDGGATKYIGSHRAPSAPECAPPSPPPAELGLDPFYTRYVDARGIPVLGSADVADAALGAACEIVVHMLAARADVRDALIETGTRVGVIEASERLTELPDYRDLYTVFPDTDWDALRGVGATTVRPMSSCGEENLLCAGDDPNAGEALLVHTFAHAIRSPGLRSVDPGFEPRLQAAYDDAMASGRFAGTFATTNSAQYWAEGVQSWFHANGSASPPDGLHGEIDTRAELIAYDPVLAALIGETLPDDDWRPGCP